jgi:hypothetical protein
VTLIESGPAWAVLTPEARALDPRDLGWRAEAAAVALGLEPWDGVAPSRDAELAVAYMLNAQMQTATGREVVAESRGARSWTYAKGSEGGSPFTRLAERHLWRHRASMPGGVSVR